MGAITHVNYSDPDGQIYCCLRNKVVKLDEEQQTRFCQGCKMFGGNAEGKGVECVWEDMRSVSDPYVVTDPILEFIKNQTRIVGVNYMTTMTAYFGG
ncbi:hypothetical protein [Paenibacillus rigui]|uniref:hypothetical protein n=1 Tax=Paenibacillus rigui TaxID=554312 RepID=UPI0015C5844E|nr:hypothetical protein [Paenibacillus rigui]